MIDLSKFSDDDLSALESGDLKKLSDKGLDLYESMITPPPPKAKDNIFTAARRGAEQELSQLRSGAYGLFNPTEAAKSGLARSEDIEARLGAESPLEKVKKVYEEKGLLPAITTGIGQIPTAIAEQAPQLATAFGGARLGALATAPFAAVAGPAAPIVEAGGALVGAFLPSFFQQYGGNIERQAQVQKEAGKDINVSGGRAAVAAVPQAALDVAETFIPFGGNIASKMFGPSVGKLLNRGMTKEAEEAAAKKLSQETFLPSIKNRDLGTVVKGTSKAAAMEIPTEVAQQMLERKQAGLDLFSPDAYKEYGDTAFSVALLGPLGIYGRVTDKAQARNTILAAQKKAQEENKSQETSLDVVNDNGEVEQKTFFVAPNGEVAPSMEDLDKHFYYKDLAEKRSKELRDQQKQVNVPPVLFTGPTGQTGSDIDEVNRKELEENYFKQVALDKQAKAQRTITSELLKSFGIGSTANIFKDNSVIGADIGNPDEAKIVKNKLATIMSRHSNPDVVNNIKDFLNRPEFKQTTPTQPTPAQVAPAQVTQETPEVEAAKAPALISTQRTPENISGIWRYIQNRDRSNVSSVNQLNKIANSPDYDRVSLSKSFTEGAPVVTGNIQIPTNQMGRQDTITTPNGEKIPVQYAVVSAKDVLPSHDVNGTKNPQYSSEDYQGLRAITNGRVAGLQAAYQRGNMEDYKTDLMHDNLHGISKETVESIPDPMLVRVMPQDMVNKHTGDVSNTGAGMTLNTVEQAKNDVNRINLKGVEFNDSGDISDRSIRQFISSMPQNEQNALMTPEGQPSKQAKDRANAAVFQQAYGNDKLTELAFQQPDEEIKNIVRALTYAAPNAINLEGLEMDIRPQVNEAVEAAINAKRNNIKLEDQVKQMDMTAHPWTSEILKIFAENPRSAKKMGDHLNSLFSAIEKSETQESDIFGHKKQFHEILKESLANKPDEGILFSKTSLDDVNEFKKQTSDYAEREKLKVAYLGKDTALLVGLDKNSGDPLYAPVKNGRILRGDVEEINQKQPEKLKSIGLTDKDINELINKKNEIEKRDEDIHKKNPFIKFKENLEFSENIPKKLIPIIKNWSRLLNLDGKIYFTTLEDAVANKDKFTGKHRRIVYADYKGGEGGFTIPIGDNERVVAFKGSSSVSYMLETIAHEMGHIHEKQTFNNASKETKEAIINEWKKWTKSHHGLTPSREFIDSLRAKTTAQVTKLTRESMPIKDIQNIDSYWRSFSEWYADQVSRWAVSSEKPLGVVEQFFSKLASGLKRFYSNLKNKGFLPNETFKQYLDSQADKLNFDPNEGTKAPISKENQMGFEFSKTRMDKNIESLDDVDPKYADELASRFGPAKKLTVREKFEQLKPNFFNRLVQGLFDEFHAIKKYGDTSYMKAVLSKSVDGALDGLLMHGHVYLKDGALDIKQGTKGLRQILEPLGKDVDRYQIWKALNRDAALPENKRSFKDLISKRDALLAGDINGVPRRKLYEQALKEENQLNKSVLDVAKQQGVIDDEAYNRFANDIYYIPFYKEMENGEVASVQSSSKLTGQYFSKALKGGEKERMNDLMENVLRNWSHILSASMKNAAAVSTLKSAEQFGAAEKVKSDFEGKTVTVMEDGKKSHYVVSDPDLVDSISLISYLGPKSPFLDVAKGFTNALRYGVTLSPGYKIRNLIRDTVQSAAISPTGMNVLDTVQRGMSLSDRGNPTFISAFAGGGVFELGAAHEGNQAALVKRLIKKGVNPETILDDPEKIKGILGDMLERYNEFGNRFENANRLALYDKMIKEGKSHLEASYASRDLLNFTGQGSWRAVKTISQVVPFFNTRLQGLYKLGRDGITPTSRVICNMATGKPIEESDKLKAQRFSIVGSAIALASIGLYMAYKDDDDFKKREDWDRDNFWWFKVGDTAFRIPKPFEIGAIGTIAERTVEQATDESIEGRVFGQRMRSVIMDNLSLNPTPQFIKPMIDLYANKDSFTGAPIETAGMERLSTQERYTNNTSELAKALGGISEGAAKILTFNPDAHGFSPVQMDYAIKSYFGWLGSTVATISDKAVEPWSGVEKPSKPSLDQYSMGFIKSLPEAQSRYVTDFYQNSERINQAFADMKRYAENGEQEKYAQILSEKGDLIALQKLYDKTTKQMAEYRKFINIITNDPKMSADDKHDQILRTRLLISQLAENAENMRKSLEKK